MRTKVAVLVLAAVATVLGTMTPLGLAGAEANKPRISSPKITQLAELTDPGDGVGTGPDVGDWFGWSIAISGPTMVVGSLGYGTLTGRVYVYTKMAEGWQQSAELQGPGGSNGQRFGYSVAISGTTIVVGAIGPAKYAGRAYVFSQTATGWQQVAELKGSDTTAGDRFGEAVAISGTTIVVGAYDHDDQAGRAYVFTRTNSGWHQAAELKGSDPVYDFFGLSVAISGTTIVVGAPVYNSETGRAYVFRQTATGWHQTAELNGSDSASGDNFGNSVAVSGNSIVVGAPVHDGDTGRVYVFTRTTTGWQQTTELKGSGIVANDKLLYNADFGYSVAIAGTTIVVGSVGSSTYAGRAYVFSKTPTGWHQAAKLKGSDTISNDRFGWSVGLSGGAVVVGAPYHGSLAGGAYVFGRASAGPEPTTTTTTSTTTTTASPTSTTATTATTLGSGTSTTTITGPATTTTTVPRSLEAQKYAFAKSCAPGTTDCAEFVTAGASGHQYTQAQYSTDGGRSWAVGSLPNTVYMAEIDAAMSCATNGTQVDCAITYATWGSPSPVGEGGYYSTDGGATWALGSVPVPARLKDNWFAEVDCFDVAGNVDCLATDMARGGMLYSTDGGAQWAVSVRPVAPFVGSLTYPGSTFACAVVGVSLDCALAGGVVPSVFTYPLPSDFNKVTAYYSTDGGRSWAKSSLARRTGELAFVACAAVAAALHCVGLGTQTGTASTTVPLIGIYTTNGGASWGNSSFPGLVQVNEKQNPWGIASLTCTPGKLALQCRATIPMIRSGKTVSTTVHSGDGGKTWSL